MSITILNQLQDNSNKITNMCDGLYMQYSSKETGFKIVHIYEKPFVSTETAEDRPKKGTFMYWEWVCINGWVKEYDTAGRKKVKKHSII